MKSHSKQLCSQVLKSDSIAGFNLTENAYPPDYQTPLHSHDYTYFCFILEGDYTLTYRGIGHLCQSSKLSFFPRGADHACRVNTHSRCLNIQLTPQLAEYASAYEDISVDYIVEKRSELNQLVVRLYQEFYTIDEFSPLTVEGLMSEITAEFLRYSDKSAGKAAPRWLLTARDFVSEEFANNLTISTIAGLADIHPTHLAREFQRHFQITIGDFVRRRRVEFACRKIIESKAPLSEIALEAGFFDQSHFTRIFKKATGMTPANYRATFQTC
jgi:AraC family transcriptional regulator